MDALRLTVVLLLGVVIGLSDVARANDSIPPADSLSLYERIGADDGLTSLVESYLARVVADSSLARIHRHRSVESLGWITGLATGFLCRETGGPCWSPITLRWFSRFGSLTPAEFVRLLDHAATTLDIHEIDADSRAEFLRILSSYEPDLVATSTNE